MDIPGTSLVLDHGYHFPVLQPVLESRNLYSYKDPIVCLYCCAIVIADLVNLFLPILLNDRF